MIFRLLKYWEENVIFVPKQKQRAKAAVTEAAISSHMTALEKPNPTERAKQKDEENKYGQHYFWTLFKLKDHASWG